MVGREIPKGTVRARDGETRRSQPPPLEDVRAVASAVGNASFARIAAATVARTPATALRARPGVRPLQRTLVLIIGEENPGSTTIADAASQTQATDDPTLGHEVEPLEQVRQSPGSLRTPATDEDIYLVAHGDNPGHPEVMRPQLGDFNAAGIVKLLERVLKPRKEPYKGTIYLSGCYTSVRLYGEEGVTGGSLLDDVALGLQGTKWASKRLAPEVQLVGYPGPETQTPGTAGMVSIESPHERHEYRKLGGSVPTQKSSTGPSIPTVTAESLVRRRWGQKPAYLTNKRIKKKR